MCTSLLRRIVRRIVEQSSFSEWTTMSILQIARLSNLQWPEDKSFALVRRGSRNSHSVIQQHLDDLRMSVEGGCIHGRISIDSFKLIFRTMSK